jgi:capsid protein
LFASLNHVRRRVGAFIRGFEAGLSSRRLKGFQPSRAHLNTLIAAAGPDVTARARWLVRDNGYAANTHDHLKHPIRQRPCNFKAFSVGAPLPC